MTPIERENILVRLRGARTEQEWNSLVDEIRTANGGEYPTWWARDVILSGLYRQVAAKWDKNASWTEYLMAGPPHREEAS